MAMPMLGYTTRGVQEGAENVRRRQIEDQDRARAEEEHRLRMEAGRAGLERAAYERSVRETPDEVRERRGISMDAAKTGLETAKFGLDRGKRDDALKQTMDAIRQAQGRLVASQGASYKDFEKIYNDAWPNDENLTIERNPDNSFTVTSDQGASFKVKNWEELGAMVHNQLNPENYYATRAEQAKESSKRQFELEKLEKEYGFKKEVAKIRAGKGSAANADKVPDREKFYNTRFLKEFTGADDDALAASAATDDDQAKAARHAALASHIYRQADGEKSDTQVIYETKQYLSRLRAVLVDEGKKQGLEPDQLKQFVEQGLDERVARLGIGVPPVDGARYSKKYGKWMVQDPNAPGQWIPHDEVSQEPATAGLSRTSGDGSTVNDAGQMQPPARTGAATTPTAGPAAGIEKPAAPATPESSAAAGGQVDEIADEVEGPKFYDIGYERAQELMAQLESLIETAVGPVRNRIQTLIDRLATIPESADRPSVSGTLRRGLRGLSNLIGE